MVTCKHQNVTRKHQNITPNQVTKKINEIGTKRQQSENEIGLFKTTCNKLVALHS